LTTVHVTYVSIFTRDVAALPSFYVDVFGLEEIAASASDRYRELAVGALKIGFPLIDAYRVLDMEDQANPTGVRSMVTFAAEDAAAVDRLTASAAAHGGRVVKGPFATAFGQYLSIVLDPEGNALRISAALSE
jgi:predicted enzyme related to lactoylglutathione lyase